MADEQVSRRGLLAAEKAGRGGDRMLGHLTPGELVVPKSCQSAELMALFAKLAHEKGMNPNRYIVGSEEASRNPRTGLEEFDDGEGDGPGADSASPGNPGANEGSPNAGPDGARDSPATGDPDNSSSATGHGTNGYGPGSSGTVGYGDAVDGIANFGERTIDGLAVNGKSLGIAGYALGMVPGIGFAMAATKGLESLTGEKGVADYGGTGGAGGTDNRPDPSGQIRLRARRGLLSSGRA